MNENTHTQKESLNRFNSEFVETLNDLKNKKKRLSKKIHKENSELSSVMQSIKELEETKIKLKTSLEKKQKNLETIENTIKSTQAAYEKIIEVSHVLLTVIKKDKRNIKE